MPAGSSFLLEYPLTVTIPSDLTTCEITFNTVTYTMKCPVDPDTRTIKIHTGLTVPIPEGSSLAIKFSPVTNPSTP